MQFDPTLLPDIESLRRRSQALAMLDAIVCPEWEGRYYSFNASWGETEAMGSMRNGSGDDWFILFSPLGRQSRALPTKPQSPETRSLRAKFNVKFRKPSLRFSRSQPLEWSR